MDGAHPLAGGVKGQLPPPGPLLFQLVFVHPFAEGQLHQRRFGGIAGAAAFAPRTVFDAHIGTEGRGGTQGLPVLLPEEPHLGHRHFVLSQGAGLVRADDARAAQGLHRRETLYNGFPPGQPAHPQ